MSAELSMGKVFIQEHWLALPQIAASLMMVVSKSSQTMKSWWTKVIVGYLPIMERSRSMLYPWARKSRTTLCIFAEGR